MKRRRKAPSVDEEPTPARGLSLLLLLWPVALIQRPEAEFRCGLDAA